MIKIKFLLNALIIGTTLLTVVNENYVFSMPNKYGNWVDRINSVDLTTGIGKTISNIVDKNICIKAETLGDSGKSYWAWRAINKELIASKDPVALKWASSIELLKKMIVSVFYRSNKFAEIAFFVEDTLRSISDTINKCYSTGIDWYAKDNIKQQIFGIINSVFVIQLLDANLKCISDNNVDEYDSVPVLLDKYNVLCGKGICDKFLSDIKDEDYKINNDRTLYDEILSKFNNNEQEFKNLFTHDAQCYLEQFNVITHTNLPRKPDDEKVRNSVIGKYVYTCYWKQRWLQTVQGDTALSNRLRSKLSPRNIPWANKIATLSNWRNGHYAIKIHEDCDKALDIWVKQKIPNLEDIVKEYNETIERYFAKDFAEDHSYYGEDYNQYKAYLKLHWYPYFKSYVKIDYGDIAFLDFIEALMQYDTTRDEGGKLLSEHACDSISSLLRGLGTWGEKPDLILIFPPLLGNENVKHLKPIDILRLTTSSYSYLQRRVGDQIKPYDDLQRNLLSECSWMILNIFDYVVFKRFTNVNVDSIIKLIKFLIDKKREDIIYDLDECSFGLYARKHKIGSWKTILESLITSGTNGKEKDFEKLVDTITHSK